MEMFNLLIILFLHFYYNQIHFFGENLNAIDNTPITTITAIIAVIVAIFALRTSQNQLEKEQEPFVVVRDDISINKNDNYVFYKIKLKNVGRGPALNITGCNIANKDNRNDPFFANNQPHSKNLCANNSNSEENEKHWNIDKIVIDSLKNVEENNEIYKNFYLYYESQLGAIYYTEVKVKQNNDNYIVMNNKRIKT